MITGTHKKRMDISNKLAYIVKGEVKADEETLKTYSRDYSIFRVRPQVVIFPKDEEDIRAVINFVNEHPEEKLTITCRSAGTDMSGGPLNESIILDFTRHFNNIKEVVEKDSGNKIAGYAVVEPGVYYRDFEKETLKHNLLFPSYPASKELCALGGIVMNNSGGEKSLTYGKTENYVEELRMILRDGNAYTFRKLSKRELEEKMRMETVEGEIYRKLFDVLKTNDRLLKEAKPKVSKNSAGYYLWNVWDEATGEFDIPKLFVGSQGTFGILTEVKLGLVRPKTHSALLVIFLKDLQVLGKLVQKVLDQKPESFESYDDQTMKFALRFLPDFLKLMGAKNMVALGLQFLPEFKMLVFGGLPKLILMAEFAANSQEEAQKRAREAKEAIKEFKVPMRVTKNQKELEKYFSIRRQSFALLHHHAQKLTATAFIDDIVVNPEHLPEFLPRLSEAIKPYSKKMMYTIAGHVGDGNFHIIPLMDLNKKDIRDVIPKLEKKVHELVMEYKGSITGEHNDGLIRTPYLGDMYGREILELFQKVKEIFDPDYIFNPGKKVKGDLAYSLAHIAVENET